MDNMEQDQMVQNEQVQVKSPHTMWAIIITAIVVAILVGGSMYLFQSQKVKSLENQLNQINKILTALAKKSVIDTTTKISTTTNINSNQSNEKTATKEENSKDLSSQYTKKLINTNSEFDTYSVLDNNTGMINQDSSKFDEFAKNIILDNLGDPNKVEITTSTNQYDTTKVITYKTSYYDGLGISDSGMIITSDKYKINKGLNIGASQDKVEQALGMPTKIYIYKDSKVTKYMYVGSMGVTGYFNFKDKKLIKIETANYRG